MKKIKKMKKVTSYCYGRKDVSFVDKDDEVFIRWYDDDTEVVGELWCQYYDADGWLQESYMGPASSFQERRIFVRYRD